MKLLSISVPSYNSEAYLERCLESLLVGGERVEIIVVDDGSTDRTGEIADRYAERYPTIVKVVHQKNSGHGEGVNKGLLLSTGLYYKVVDSDDMLDKECYLALLEKLEHLYLLGSLPDLVIADFIYERNDGKKKSHYVSSFGDYFPEERIIGWEKVKGMHFHHLLLMHALYYKRDVLVNSQTILPLHCFYVDDIFAYKPLPYCNSIYYVPRIVYRYQIGRDDQSVNQKNFVKRYPMLCTIMDNIYGAYSLDDIYRMPKGLKKYMLHTIGTLNLTALFAICGGSDNYIERKKTFRRYFVSLKNKDKRMYRKVKYGSYYSLICWMPYLLRRKVIIGGYKMTKKIAKVG